MPWMLWLACASESTTDPQLVVLPDAWVQGDLTNDPLAAHQPASIDCPPSTWGYEDGRLEVQTGACTYAWLVQPAGTELRAGDQLTILSWHQGLDAPFEADAHLALVVDGEVFWDMWTGIPSYAEVFEGEVTVPRAIPKGAEVGIHLHNHGFNSWSVGDVTRWP